MKECLLVGLGGALGAMLRYLLSLLPVGGHLPLMTLSINVVAETSSSFATPYAAIRLKDTCSYVLTTVR